MKREDALIETWERILAQRSEAPAIFNARGEIVRTFRQIDHAARDFESKIDNLEAGQVLAVQIGNHEDWPSILIASLRRRIVVLPLEQSISEQQRDAALKVCNAAGIVTLDHSLTLTLSQRERESLLPCGEKVRISLLILTSGTYAMPRAIRFRSEQ